MKGSFPNRVRVWFRSLSSRESRRASELLGQVERLVNEQRDLLASDAIGAIERAQDELAAGLAKGASGSALQESVSRLESVANERLLAFPHGAVRENVKEMAVAITVI